ncbi:hypothetical protein EBI_22773 [Enterocytozoon bieneusi H348]|nr:hypothetical protein EBI_22773 [Enterocytozoon bieneusi H348]|eukprot:XP_002649677.1 hypothetical protein EBI_22773 [Enterocytozoon bieneusi H348]
MKVLNMIVMLNICMGAFSEILPRILHISNMMIEDYNELVHLVKAKYSELKESQLESAIALSNTIKEKLQEWAIESHANLASKLSPYTEAFQKKYKSFVGKIKELIHKSTQIERKLKIEQEKRIKRKQREEKMARDAL